VPISLKGTVPPEKKKLIQLVFSTSLKMEKRGSQISSDLDFCGDLAFCPGEKKESPKPIQRAQIENRKKRGTETQKTANNLAQGRHSLLHSKGRVISQNSPIFNEKGRRRRIASRNAKEFSSLPSFEGKRKKTNPRRMLA